MDPIINNSQAAPVRSTSAQSTSDFADWTTQRLLSVERMLEQLLNGCGAQPPQLLEAMRYAVLDGGKRIRPLLVYATGELSQASAASLDLAAGAVELIHAYSLGHDDLPCMDNDTYRRGKLSTFKHFGNNEAILSSYYMISETLRIIVGQI